MFSAVQIVFFILNQMQSNIGPLFKILNWIAVFTTVKSCH